MIQAIDKTTENYDMPIEKAIELARGHHMIGNFILAERTYNDILRTDPNNPTVNHLLGAMYYQVDNEEKASFYLKKSVELDSEEKQYWSNYGSFLLKIEKFDEAIECFDKALTIDPLHLESLNRKSLTYLSMDLYEEAEKSAKKTLEVYANNIDGFLNLGLAYSLQKKFDQANMIWEEADTFYPNNIQILSNWSNSLREIRYLKLAKEKILQAIDISPENTESLNNLGCILKDFGQYEEAIKAYKEATNLSPKLYEAHYNMALCHYDLGQYDQAVVAARYAIDFRGNYSDAYNILSASLVEIGDFSKAHFAAQRAVQIDPDKAESYLHLADVLYLSNNFDDGHAALKEALKRDPDNAQTYFKLSNVYERLDEVEEALEAIDKAIELQDNIPSYIAKKASILHMSNQTDDALVVIDKVLDIVPNFISALITKAEILVAVNKNDEALEILQHAKKINLNHPLIYFVISNIKKFTSLEDEDLKTMIHLSNNSDGMSVIYKSSLHYALSRAYEDIKEYKKSFECLDIASKAKRKTVPYNKEQAPLYFNNIKNSYNQNKIEQYAGKGFKSNKPVFIVGMPRSGTTLTEQIISSHPDVFGAGELPDIIRAQRIVGSITPDTAQEVGKTYIDLITARDKNGHVKRIVDKMPANYMNIGLILNILPDAKIIHCCRNAMDTCLSNYKQNFMAGQFWSYDLEEMGQEYLRYLDLMDHWHKIFPGQILDVHYEETVGDLETQARQLIDYINLTWDEACLEPHKQKRSVLTASKAQVTKPVYQSSVKKWKKYENALEPLVKIFEDNGLEV